MSVRKKIPLYFNGNDILIIVFEYYKYEVVTIRSLEESFC